LHGSAVERLRRRVEITFFARYVKIVCRACDNAFDGVCESIIEHEGCDE